MSYCYADDETSDQPSPHHYDHLMPESPLQHKLSPNPSSHVSRVSSTMSPNSQLEHEKRVRREIANSNERRRMQSINTGFHSLKILIPHSCGEKLSKACILQRAADHIKSLESEKMKLQSQNEQFRVLIKSFQIDSTSVLQAQRRLSTNGESNDHRTRLEPQPKKCSDQDETVLLLNHDTKHVDHDESDDEQLRLYQDVKTRHTFTPNWHSGDNLSHYPSTGKDESHEQQIHSHYYPNSSSYRPIQCVNSKGSPPTPSDTTAKATQPSQRCYKTNSLDQPNDNGMVILERCQLRTQSVDTNNNTNNSSTSSNVLHHPVSRRNLQTIVEAIRHLEGDDALANITPQPSATQQEDLPAQIKALIHEKFQQQTNKTSSTNALYSQTINMHEPSPQQTNSMSHDIDLHHKPPKKRKITYNENDDIIEQTTTIPIQDLPPSMYNPDRHEQISSVSPLPSSLSSQTLISNVVGRSPPTVAQLLQEHLLQRTIRYPSSTLFANNLQRHPQT